jgi:hypothetical protein
MEWARWQALTSLDNSAMVQGEVVPERRCGSAETHSSQRQVFTS